MSGNNLSLTCCFLLRCTMMKKLVLGIAVCCGINGVNGMGLIDETLAPSMERMSESSSGEVSEMPDNSSDDEIDSKLLSKLACDAVEDKAVVDQLIKALVDRELSADIIEGVYYDLQCRKECYVGRHNDFMEILNLLGMVHYVKHEGRCLQGESLLEAYNKGEFKEIEAGGPFDEFEP